jgi:hypothetical protein
MDTLLQERWWSRAEAVLRIVFGQLVPAAGERTAPKLRSVEAWLEDPIRCQMPTNDDLVAARLKLFSKAASEELPGWGVPNLRLAPVTWVWFAFAHARGAVAQRFHQALDAWTAELMLAGEVPIALFLKAPIGRGKLNFLAERQDPDGGVPLSTLLLRPFESDYAKDTWRVVIHRVAAPRRRAAPRQTRTHSPDSPACTALLLEALQALAQNNRAITRAKKSAVSAGSKPFTTQEWNRSELLERLIATRSGKALTVYGHSTLLRALSSLVESRKGRPPRSLEPPAAGRGAADSSIAKSRRRLG